MFDKFPSSSVLHNPLSDTRGQCGSNYFITAVLLTHQIVVITFPCNLMFNSYFSIVNK